MAQHGDQMALSEISLVYGGHMIRRLTGDCTFTQAPQRRDLRAGWRVAYPGPLRRCGAADLIAC